MMINVPVVAHEFLPLVMYFDWLLCTEYSSAMLIIYQSSNFKRYEERITLDGMSA